jgi:AraC family transcriptional regulator
MPVLGSALVTNSKESALTSARFRHDAPHPAVKSLPAQDAFVAIMQVSPLPAHDLWIGDKHYTVDAGSNGVMNIANLDEPFACRIARPFENIHIHIPRSVLDDVAEEANAPKIDRLLAPNGWETADPVVQGVQTSLLTALARPEEISRLFADHLHLALVAHLARTYGNMQEGQRLRSGGLAPWQERRAKELIAANLGKEISLERVARECHLSVSYFSRAFKVSTGMTPHEWLQICRIERAKDMMMAAEVSLAEVALACGFADQSHFTKIFTRNVGNTPGAWQRLRRAA